MNVTVNTILAKVESYAQLNNLGATHILLGERSANNLVHNLQAMGLQIKGTDGRWKLIGGKLATGDTFANLTVVIVQGAIDYFEVACV